MPDYRSNSFKDREDRPEKKVEPVVAGDNVIVQKRSVGRKFKDVFVKADLKSSAWYVISEVLIPGARDMLFDGVTRYAERMFYGEMRPMPRNFRSGLGSRISYQSPVSRGYRRESVLGRSAPTPLPEPRSRRASYEYERDDLILTSKEMGEDVLEGMKNIIEGYESASIADLYELMSLPSPNAHVDNKWGWISMDGWEVRPVRQGWLIDFPPPEPLI